MTPLLLAQIVLTLFIFVALLSSAAAMVWVERRVAALLQQRRGPTRVGWQGLLQPFADVIKLMFKEELRAPRIRCSLPWRRSFPRPPLSPPSLSSRSGRARRCSGC
jgi:NADH:ubiquinone oxidoreductase subunit H